MGTGTRRRESEGEQGGSIQKGGDAGCRKAGGLEDETPSVSRVCAELQEVLRGEVRESGRRWQVRSILGHITFETVGTRDWSLTCKEYCRQILSRYLSGEQSYCRYIHIGVERLQGGGVGGAKRAQRWNCNGLSRSRALIYGGAAASWRKRREI